MQVGDTKKAIVLAVVALLILSVAAFQLVGKGKKTPAAVATRAAAGNSPSATEAYSDHALPTVLTSQPFTLHTPETKKPTDPNVNQAITPNAPQSPPAKGASAGSSNNNIPLGVRSIDISPEGNGLPPGPGLPPVENTGKDQPKKEESKSATLIAIIRVDHRIAILTVTGNAAPIKCAMGTYIEGYRVIELSDSQVILKKGDKRLPISVGGTVDL
jgi:hypothetical protein